MLVTLQPRFRHEDSRAVYMGALRATLATLVILRVYMADTQVALYLSSLRL